MLRYSAVRTNFLRAHKCVIRVASDKRTRRSEEIRESQAAKNIPKCAARLISSSLAEATPYVIYINHVPFVLRRKFDFIHPPLTSAKATEV